MAPIMTGISTGLLAPVVALNIWTFGMEAWMYATRIPAAEKYGADLRSEATKEAKGVLTPPTPDFNRKLPASVRWKADNYNHLHEQPTQFYALALTLALLGDTTPSSQNLAWTYVSLRVMHSLIQSIGNKIMLRFSVFITSSAVLVALTVKAASIVF
ncbi:KRR1 small subunit processome component [Venturia inaequalis]|nr:KRR1 small subunit processome component [Venturia inaequalis]